MSFERKNEAINQTHKSSRPFVSFDLQTFALISPSLSYLFLLCQVLIHPPTHPSTHSSIHPLIHPPTYSSFHSAIHPLIHFPPHSFSHPAFFQLIHPSSHPSIFSSNSTIRSTTNYHTPFQRPSNTNPIFHFSIVPLINFFFAHHSFLYFFLIPSKTFRCFFFFRFPSTNSSIRSSNIFSYAPI